MDSAWKTQLDTLIASAKTKGEAGELLRELLTPAEYDEIARRWQVIKLLIEKKPQREIRDSLSVSIATVTRGSRELQYGKGAFKKFYKRLQRK